MRYQCRPWSRPPVSHASFWRLRAMARQMHAMQRESGLDPEISGLVAETQAKAWANLTFLDRQQLGFHLLRDDHDGR